MLDALRGRANRNSQDQTAGAAGSAREDDIKRFMLGVNYKMRRWLILGVGASYGETESNSVGESDDRSKVYLALRAEF